MVIWAKRAPVSQCDACHRCSPLVTQVKDPKQLEAVVLPKYFRHSRFQSLVRQLNFYNFKKVSKDRHSWVYHHELFHRDKPVLLDGLKRKSNERSPTNGSHPDFAALETAIPPLVSNEYGSGSSPGMASNGMEGVKTGCGVFCCRVLTNSHRSTINCR